MLLKKLNFNDRDFVARGIFAGLANLHSRGIGHKHMKSDNVLLNLSDTKDILNAEIINVKLCDFGESRLKLESSSNGYTNGKGEPTVRWRARETFSREYAMEKDRLDLQKRSNVFSAALVLWETNSRRKPFHNHSEMEVVRLVNLGTREEISPSDPYKAIIKNCWSFIPSSSEVYNMIDDVYKEYQKLKPPVAAAPVSAPTPEKLPAYRWKRVR